MITLTVASQRWFVRLFALPVLGYCTWLCYVVTILILIVFRFLACIYDFVIFWSVFVKVCLVFLNGDETYVLLICNLCNMLVCYLIKSSFVALRLQLNCRTNTSRPTKVGSAVTELASLQLAHRPSPFCLPLLQIFQILL